MTQAEVNELMARTNKLENEVKNSDTFSVRRFNAGAYVAGCNGMALEINKVELDDGIWWTVSEIGFNGNYTDPIATYRDAKEEARLWIEEMLSA